MLALSESFNCHLVAEVDWILCSVYIANENVNHAEMSDLHEVEEGIVSKKEVKESEFTTRDVLQLIFAKLMA